MIERIAPGQVIERYVVESHLGSGGMATVWLLRHRHLGTQHALKVLTHLGPNAELRLMLEGRVQAALRHPNIVAVTDILDVGGAPGLLMEYVPPPSLAVWLAGHQPTIDEAESLFRGIVDGVRHAHRYGLVHRDLKPSNVLLARYDDEGLVPKVADFGLAKLLDEEHGGGHTRSGLTMGTPQYMAPEQIRDAKKVDRRADMFSLGCILYELLSGRPPYAWTDFITLYNEVVARQYPPLPSHVPARLLEAVEGLLEPERDARLSDCDALLAVLDGRPLPSSPTVTPENLGRMVDVPVLRDRVLPPVQSTAGAQSSTFYPEGPTDEEARGTAPSDATLVGALPIGDAPRAIPMPQVAAAPPTMVPSDSLGDEPAPSMGSLRPATPRRWGPGVGGLGALGLLALIGGIAWRALEGPVEAPRGPVVSSSMPTDPGAAGTIGPSGAPVTEGASERVEGASVATGSIATAPAGASMADAKGSSGSATGPSPGAVRPPAPTPGPDAGSPSGSRTGGSASTPPPPLQSVAPESTSAPVAAPLVVTVPGAPAVSIAHVSADAQGDASRIELVGAGGRFTLPADVPPGTYDVYAWFPDAPQTKTTRVTVAAGDSASLRCLSFSMSCLRR